MKKSVIWLTVVVTLLTTSVSCSAPETRTASDSDVSLSGEVLAGIPVYPESTPVTSEEYGFEPFSTPLIHPDSKIPLDVVNPVYETSSAWYTAEAGVDKILNWYEGKLGANGYRKYTDVVYNDPGGYDVHSMGFYRPEQQLISAEIHVYDVPDTPVYVILVSYDTTTSPDK